MPTVTGTFETLALELGRALAPLKDLLDPESLLNLGLELPRELANEPGLVAALTAARTTATEVDGKIASLEAAITAGDVATIVIAGVAMTTLVSELITRLTAVGTALHSAASALPPAERAPLQDLAGKLGRRAFEALVVSYLNAELPSLATTLAVLGLVDMAPQRGRGLDVSYVPVEPVAPRLYLDRVSQLLQDPDQYLRQTFKWGDGDFDGGTLLRKLQALLESFSLPAAIYTRPNGSLALEAFAFVVETDSSVSPPGLTFELSLPGDATFDEQVDFTSLWKGKVHADAHFAAGLSGTLRPPFTLRALPPSGSVALNLTLGLTAEKTLSDPIVLLGATGGSQLSAKSISGRVGVVANLDATGGEVTPTVQLSIEDGRLVIDFSKGDGFIQKLLSGVHLDAAFGLAADWNPKDGLRLQGQGGVEVFVPLHIDLSVVQISGLYVAIGLGSSPAPISIVLATQITTELGPLTAVVDRIGLRAAIGFPDGGGNLGLADIAFAFQPPSGVGLSIDAGAMKGGGFLRLDPDKGEYFGCLELSFQDVITLKAIGIINTKMPDGSKGFALLILITAEFAPIQLGFGFTLVGVGGLLALNRTLDEEALRIGVRTGAVNSILFPQDIVANIVRIISDLKTIFPLAQDHFIIGPMGKLGWGTPTLISLEIGVILDLPRPMFVLVGVLRCILPAADAAILKLQVNFAGGVDFEAGRIWFDASLFDSRLLLYTLTGDMALRINWGDEKLFVLSVGGFHPAFKEVPADLRSMRRISISLLPGDNPRLNVQTYFAVTSNTVQSGSKVELYAAACGFNIYGFLGYDLLVHFPFRFEAQIYAGLALRKGSDVIAGISAKVELTGPTPWRARGEASLEILFFEITVDFDVTWGDEAGQIEQTEDVYRLIRDAVRDDRNWTAQLPANTRLGVTQRTLTLPPATIVVQPFGRLAVSQKVVPLGFDINTFGNKRPVGRTRFELIFAGGEEVREEFAVANFLRMSDSDKLSRKSFERMRSGISFTPDSTTKTGASVAKEVNYELSYVHRASGARIDGGLYRMASSVFSTLVKGGAIARSPLAVASRVGGTPPASIGVRETEYVVVNVSNLSPHAPTMVAKSETEAYMLQAQAVAQNPALAGMIQVMSSDELG